MSSKRNDNAGNAQPKTKARGKIYTARLARGSGERKIVISEVGLDVKQKNTEGPPCLTNHAVKPLF